MQGVVPLSVHRRCLLVIVVVVAVSPCLSSSSCPLPLPIVLLLPVSTPRAVARGGGWGVLWWWWWWPSSSSWSLHSHCTVGGAGSCPSFCCCPLPVSVPSPLLLSLFWPRCFPSPPREKLLTALVGRPSTRDPPREQVRAAAVGVVVSSPRSRRAPRFHPASSCSRRQLGVLPWCQLVPAIRRPVVHPASRGWQRWSGHRGCRLVFISWGNSNVAGGSYLVVFPLPWAP